MDILRPVLAALYATGAPRSFDPRMRSWPLVVRALRRQAESMPPAEALRRAGLWPEALALEDPSLLQWASTAVQERRVLTAACAEYPSRWLSRLGEAAPPALRLAGDLSASPWIAIIGRRHADGQAMLWASEIAEEAVRLGFGVISGSALGVDQAALEAASKSGGATFGILPHGRLRPPRSGAVATLAAPGEPFSTASAMVRNTLIFAAAEHAVVVQATFKCGGTWHGATEALRRKLCPVSIRSGDDLAPKALAALGAIPLSSPHDLEGALSAAPRQASLFALG